MQTQTFLRRPAVESRTGLKRSTLYDLIAAGEFPKPVRLGKRIVGWLTSEVADWERQRVAKRDGMGEA